MGKTCAVNNCNSRNFKGISGEDVSMHVFPRDSQISTAWENSIKTLNNQIDVNRKKYVCGKHFTKECYWEQITYGPSQHKLKKKAVPTIFPFSKGDIYENVEYLEEEYLEEEYLSNDDKPPEAFNIYDYDSLNLPVCTSSIAFDEQHESELFTSINECNIESEMIEENLDSYTHLSTERCDTAYMETESRNDKSNTLTTGLRDPGDVFKINITTPRTTKKAIGILKKSHIKQNRIINQLRSNVFRRDKKIRSLKQLLDQLRDKKLMSDNLEANLKVR